MLKGIYPVGSVVVVTTTHRALPYGPYAGVGTKVTIESTSLEPYTNSRFYMGRTETGERVSVSDMHVELAPSVPFPEGALVFVTETHTGVSGVTTNYAGTHLRIISYIGGAGFYAVTDKNGLCVGSVRADKIARVESEPEKLTPPVAPSYVGKQGEVVWQEKGTEAGGYWTYDNYWGWSNFVPVKADLYRTPVKGEDMHVNGTLATSALDGTVQAV